MNHWRNLRFYVERRNFGRSVEVEMYVPHDNGTTSYVSTMTFATEKDDASSMGRPSALSLNLAQAQSLMDGLWEAGVRPTEGTGSAGSLAATERHLKDMQRIAMGLLRLDGDLP